MVKLHLQAVAVQTVPLRQPAGIISLGPQSHIGKTFPVNPDGAWMVLLLRSRLEKPFPVLNQDFHLMDF